MKIEGPNQPTRFQTPESNKAPESRSEHLERAQLGYRDKYNPLMTLEEVLLRIAENENKK